MNPQSSNLPTTDGVSAAQSPRASLPAADPEPPRLEHDFSSGPPKRSNHEGWRSALSTIVLFMLAPLIALSIAAFAFQSYQVDGASMETTLQNRDRLIVFKVPRTLARLTNNDYIPNRGDIIIFNQAGIYDAAGGPEKQLIKRVVGLPGERVVVKDGTVTVFNKDQPDGFNPDTLSGSYRITAGNTPGSSDVTIRAGEVYVLGDNRTNSTDSRIFGPVSSDHIVGKLLVRIMPLSKIERF